MLIKLAAPLLAAKKQTKQKQPSDVSATASVVSPNVFSYTSVLSALYLFSMIYDMANDHNQVLANIWRRAARHSGRLRKLLIVKVETGLTVLTAAQDAGRQGTIMIV